MKIPALFSMLTRSIAACLIMSVPVIDADDWPQWMGPQRDGVWRETGIVEKLPANGATPLER